MIATQYDTFSNTITRGEVNFCTVKAHTLPVMLYTTSILAGLANMLFMFNTELTQIQVESWEKGLKLNMSLSP